METVSHRELRNNSGTVLHAVESGESYTVTTHGRPVARLVPIAGAVVDLPLHRPATKRGFRELVRTPSEVSVATALDDLRGDR